LTAEIVDTNENNSAEVATFSLDAHHAAIENDTNIACWGNL